MSEQTVVVFAKKTPPKVDVESGTIIKKRVAAYARVSTDASDQLNSLETQKSEYMRKIQENPEWEFAGIYADEGITGTSLKRRASFNKMISDAKAGLIDIILVKSISRFARNTVDCINTKRELQQIGVGVQFEKENIFTLNEDSETMITMYASFAQEESRQISTNITWGIRARMRSGTFKWYRKGLLGYRMNEEGKLVIEKEEAETVQMIFDLFLEGKSYRDIVAYLESKMRKNGRGVVNWTISDIMHILTNEKYCGDVILQKTYCTSYLTHERAVNNGEKEQYLLPEHHEAIISKEKFMFAQEFRNSRYSNFDPTLDKGNSSAASVFTYCAECGRQMRKTQYYKGKPFERNVLTCKTTSKGSVNYIDCGIKQTIDFDAVNMLITHIVKEKLGGIDLELITNAIIDSNVYVNFAKRHKELKEKIAAKEEELTQLVQDNIKSNFLIKDYQKRYDQIKSEITLAKECLESLTKETVEKQKRANFMSLLSRFLENKEEINPRIASLYIQRIYRQKDNSLLVIVSKEKTTKKELEEIRKNIALLDYIPKQTFTYEGRSIEYRLLEMEK